MRRDLLLTLTLCISVGIARGQTEYRYWFDSDISTLQSQSVSAAQWQTEIDLSGLAGSIHTIHFQVKDKNGNLTPSETSYFYLPMGMQPEGNGYTGYHCWIDDDIEHMVYSSSLKDPVLLDTEVLKPGMHYIYAQCDGSVLSPVVAGRFFKATINEEAYNDLRVVFTINDSIYKSVPLDSENRIVNWDVDVSDLKPDLYWAYTSIVTSSNETLYICGNPFYVDTEMSEMSGMNHYYFLDGKTDEMKKAVQEGRAFHLDIDMVSLPEGMHSLTYLLADESGKCVNARTTLFYRKPLGELGLKRYEYWLNDEPIFESKLIEEQPKDFSLISLLPVPIRPIRSSCYHFAVEDGKPVIYAKNEFHLRIHGTNKLFSDESAYYIDERVRQEVNDVEWLISGVRATTAKPAENTIKWYQLTAQRGDSLSFKLDRAATFQVFTPSGEELFSVSGIETANWFGCHVEEDGIFYVALHDVTAQQGSTISIDYEHIDKYAVLRQDVSEVGNSGSSIITFYGNGFDELTDIYLVCNSDTIHAAEIGHESKAMTSVTFDFDGVTLGKYKAVFQFPDGNLELENCITVEEPTPIDIDVTATFGKNHLLSHHKTKYIFSVRNNSNVTAYDVPLLIRIYTHDKNSLQRIDIEGHDLKKDCKTILGELYTDSLDYVISQVRRYYGDRFYFIESDSTDIIEGWAAHMHQAFVCPTIPPHSTKDIAISLELGQNVYCYMWHPEIWDDMAASRSNGRRLANSNLGCSISAFLHLINCWQHDASAYMGSGSGYVAVNPPVIPGSSGYVQVKRKSPFDCGDYNKPMDCPPDGGKSAGYNSSDPNDITGYTSESGSKFVMGDVLTLDYAIEFENDTAFATAAAHTIVVKDTLDSHFFELNSYKPTSVRIGGKSAELDGSQNFVKTIDMRPEIYAIAQVEGTFDKEKGIATWTFTSLDPMTGEPTEDFMAGILPVNYDGNSGVGKVFFDVNLKQQFAQGTEIPNRAGIVFDQNETIMTPTWTNTIDRIAPESHVTDVQMLNDSTATVSIEAVDELSGPWRYNVYVQYGSGAWFLGAENVPVDTTASVKVYEGINHGFYVVVTDSAGNVEQKAAEREFSFEVFAPQVDTNTKIELAQGWNWISHNQQEVLGADALKPKALRIVSQTDELFKDSRFGWTGTIDELLPTELYKVQMVEADEVQLSGRLFNATFRSVPLFEGWNWMGYPVAHAMTPAEALQKMEAEEGDFIVGQDGMVTFTDGQWTGTLMEMIPGQGYMYRSVSDKNLFFNASAQTSSRRVSVQGSRFKGQGSMPEGWTIDKRKYPNVMGVVADLYKDGELVDASEWAVAAFCGDECRGLTQVVNGHLMMNVYGTGGEPIVFVALKRESGELVFIEESEAFRTDILGTMQQPYMLHTGVATGISLTPNPSQRGEKNVYMLDGRRVDKSSMVNEGIYIVTDGNNAHKYVNQQSRKK